MNLTKPALALLAASLLVSSGLVSSQAPLATFAAEQTATETTLNYATVTNYGSVGEWKTGTALPETSDALEDAAEYHLFRNVISSGAGFLGESIAEAIEDSPSLVATLDKIHLDKSNVNLYAGNVNLSFSIGYDMMLFTALTEIAAETNKIFVVPALIMDDTIVAAFRINATEAKIITPNEAVTAVSQSYCVYQAVDYYTSGGSPVSHYVYQNDVLFTFKKGAFTNVREICTPSYGNYVTEQSNEYTYEYALGYVEDGLDLRIPHHISEVAFSLPYEITYFDYGNGYFGVGHSAYGEVYGSARQRMAVKDIRLTVYSQGQYNDVHLTGMDAGQYSTWVNYDEKFANRFVYLSRPRLDDEVGGEGSLVKAYYVPLIQYDITVSSYITVKEITFYDKEGSEAYVPSTVTEHHFQIPGTAIRFEYYADQATARCYYEFEGINISDESVSQISFGWDSWWRWIARVANPLLADAVFWLGEQAANYYANKGLNCQRLYFNMYSSDNKLIQNAFKIDFHYQQGRKEVNRESDGSLVSKAKPYDDLDPLYAEAEVKMVNSTWYHPMGGVSVDYKTNGFATCEEEPHKINGREYSYYYQNIYNTDTFSDFMCWWEPLSIWYTVPATGETVRATTASDGTFAVKNGDGDYVVMSLDEPGKVLDIDFDDWVNGVTGNGTNYGIEDGEKNATDQTVDGIVSFFKDGFYAYRTVLGIALGVVGIAFIAYLVLKYFGFMGMGGRGGSSTVVNVNGAAEKPKRKRKKK